MPQSHNSPPSLKSFISAFGHHWADYASGGPSVPLTIAALFMPNKWAAIGTGFLGIACGLFASYRVWSAERQRLLYARRRIGELEHKLTPAFRVYFDQERGGMVDAITKSTSHTGMSAYGTPIIQEKSTRSKYFRIWVEATSAATVEQCEGYIVSLERRNNENEAFIHAAVPQPLSLKAEPFDVVPGVRRAIDFVMSDETGRFDHSPEVYWPYTFDNFLSQVGTYRFTFVVHGGGVTAPSIRVEVHWRGQWDAIFAEQVA
jgi:hypothetical protein